MDEQGDGGATTGTVVDSGPTTGGGVDAGFGTTADGTVVDARTTTLSPATDRGRTEDVDVRYLVAGEGPPVVLLHGIGLDDATVSWRHLLADLATRRRVYALDFPGHGGSGKPRVRYTTAFFRRVLAAFLDDRGLGGAPLVGISMGGAVALGHALEHPVDRLVLVDSYGLGGDAAWRPAASAFLRVPFAHRGWWTAVGASEASVRAHLETMCSGRPPDDLVTDVYRAVQDAAVGRAVGSWQRSEFRACGLATDYRDRLADLAAETLLVHGAGDPLLPAEWSRAAADRIPDATLRVVEDCGHWPPRERPAAFNGAVAGFL